MVFNLSLCEQSSPQKPHLVNLQYRLEDVRAQKFPRTDFFKLAKQKGNDILLPKKQKKKWGSPTSREHDPKNTLNLKNRASLADKATVSVSPEQLQLSN